MALWGLAFLKNAYELSECSQHKAQGGNLSKGDQEQENCLSIAEETSMPEQSSSLSARPQNGTNAIFLKFADVMK